MVYGALQRVLLIFVLLSQKVRPHAHSCSLLLYSHVGLVKYQSIIRSGLGGPSRLVYYLTPSIHDGKSALPFGNDFLPALPPAAGGGLGPMEEKSGHPATFNLSGANSSASMLNFAEPLLAVVKKRAKAIYGFVRANLFKSARMQTSAKPGTIELGIKFEPLNHIGRTR